ncbi:hypothetical protein [Thermospira aquatica]|uniref:Uncharacterized protein n=1 Tax=Thermospira aquatica TaxID=2828656 RepID=A0AAX3BDF9_9SPIR|nr:hypothetical protein [Thermospira aquatica]URA10266.1 hypothetical protein KDW03_00220 [Thermospira aquatica]
MDSIQVSSLWRNSATSPHGSGRGIDIVAVTRGNLTVRFNNSTVGPQSQAAMALRNEVYNSMVNDQRVSQALDPWWVKSKIPGNTYNQPNVWQQGYPNGNLSKKRYNFMYKHRHHLHLTIRR